MNSELTTALRRTVSMCQQGFASYDAAYYDRIAEILEPHAGVNEKVERMVRLAKGGHDLSSPRFAYPHIESDARRLLGSV